MGLTDVAPGHTARTAVGHVPYARRVTHPPENRLGSLEARVVRDIWSHGSSPVSDVLQRLNDQAGRPLAYTTVMSVMVRLAEKGILKRHRVGKSYWYEARVPESGLEAHLARREIRAILADYGPVAVAGFIDEMGDNELVVRAIQETLEGLDKE